MKIIFSEYKHDHGKYVYPYAIWAFPEKNDTPANLYNAGFLPSAKNLSKFYMCRHIRVPLKNFELSSENKRILKKNKHIKFKLIKKQDFDYNTNWKNFCLNYAKQRWSKKVMPAEKLDDLFQQLITSHVLIFNDTQKNRDVGLVTLFIEEGVMAHYYYAFYNLDYLKNNLGMQMMTSAVKYFAEQNFKHIYLGTCYSKNALYKTQFKNTQFFNGIKWSDNLRELKYLIDHNMGNKHLLESEFCDEFYNEEEIKKNAKHLAKR